jgi:transcriptional regulator with XRE-family HTH domain
VAKDEDLRRIGRAVAARRGELGLTQQDLADAAGIDLKTVYNLESGTRWPIARTRGAIAAALGWGPDAFSETEFRGGVSVSLPTAIVPPRRPPDDDPHGLHRRGDLFPGMSGQMQAEVEPLFREIEARVLRAASEEARRRTEAEGRPVWIQDVIDEVPPGALVFPGGDARALTWDRLAARGYTTWQLAQGIAVVMVLDPARHSDSGDAATGLAGRLRGA